MQMKKVVKGIVAVGSAAMLMGSTVLGATMDLSNYPTPFSEDGEFNGNIVVGANAATADVIGAVDVASALQAANVEETPVSVEGSAGASVSVENGIDLAGRKELTLGDNLTSVRSRYDSNALSDLLGERELVDQTSSKDRDYSERLNLGDSPKIEFGNINVDGDGNIVSEYVSLDGAKFNLTLDFDNSVDFTGYTEGETLELLGREFTIDDSNTDDSELALFGSTNEASLELGESQTFTIGGEEVEIEVVGGSEDSAVLNVNGNSRSVSIASGESYDSFRVNGEEVRVTDIMYSDIGDRVFIIVNVMLGSDELLLPANGQIKFNEDTVSGIESNISVGTGYENASEIIIQYDLASIKDDSNHEFYDSYDDDFALLPGDSITEPLFNEITLAFEGVKGEFESGDYVDFGVKSDDELSVEFTNYDDEEVSIDVDFSDFDWNVAGDDISSLDKDEYFIHNEVIDADDNEVISRVFKVTDADTDEIQNVLTGEKREYEEGDYFYGDDDFSASVTSDMFYTYDGLTVNVSQFSNLSDNTLTKANVTLGGSENVTVSYDSDADSPEVKLGFSESTSSFDEDVGDEDVGYYLNDHGTYVVVDEDESERLEVYYPGEDAREFAAALGNNDVEITVTEGEASEVMTETVNKIGSGMAYLDSEMDVEGRNIISVGGPAANDVSAELLGDYAGPEGFGEGQAFIKLVENGDDVAMVVAGYSAQDTRHASSVLADYEDYDLSGEEVLVSGTSMDEIEVNSVE